MTPSREYRDAILALRQKLIQSHEYSRARQNCAKDTTALMNDSVGKESAIEIVAVMILCKGEWDGRISPANRAWAEDVASYTRAELAQIPGLYYCDEIHPVHLDQIANIYRKETNT